MKLSIITITLNNREGFLRTVESIVGQTFRNFEFIVVDGGSSDGSVEIIKHYADYISWWCSEPDNGIYDAMNKGIANSHGEYLLFLNSADTFYDRNVLSEVVPYLQGKDFYVGDEIRGDWRLSVRVNTPQQICKTILSGFIPHQATFINRRIFDLYGPYRCDKKYVSDWWMFFNALIVGDATIEKLPMTTTVFDMCGISSLYPEKMHAEMCELVSELPQMLFLTDFYKANFEIMEALRGTPAVFFLFRIFFFIYRKCIRKCQKLPAAQ